MRAHALICNLAHGFAFMCTTHCRTTLFSLRIHAEISSFDCRIGMNAENIGSVEEARLLEYPSRFGASYAAAARRRRVRFDRPCSLTAAQIKTQRSLPA